MHFPWGKTATFKLSSFCHDVFCSPVSPPYSPVETPHFHGRDSPYETVASPDLRSEWLRRWNPARNGSWEELRHQVFRWKTPKGLPKMLQKLFLVLMSDIRETSEFRERYSFFNKVNQRNPNFWEPHLRAAESQHLSILSFLTCLRHVVMKKSPH